MRSYEKSHPWITFSLDLKKLSYKNWIALGEAKSKCEHIATTPLVPEVAKRMHELYLAKGALGTTAIEGNTLSEKEVINKIEGKLTLPPSKEYLGIEIDNIVSACNLISDELLESDTIELNRSKLELYNGLVLKNLEIGDGVVPGKIRKHAVGINGVRYKGAPSEDCEFLIDKLCTWLNIDFNSPISESTIIMGIIKAIIAHIYIAWIHPFGDGNGRTARLVEFQILLASGVPTPAAHLLSNYYNETRQEYYKQLKITSSSGGDLIPFIEYAIDGLVESLKNQLSLIREQVFDVTWENYIHDQFKTKNKKSDIRQRHLALDISQNAGPVKVSDVRHLSPRVAEHYAGKTKRTIDRDLKTLIEMEIINISKEGLITPNSDLMLSFLPRRRRLAK